MRIIAIIVEVAASRLTKIPVSDQVGFLSSRFTAQSRPQKLIVPKNRLGRERINFSRRDNPAPTRSSDGSTRRDPNWHMSASPNREVLISTPTGLESSIGRVDVAKFPKIGLRDKRSPNR